MPIRNDLNGLLVTNSDSSEPWYLIDRGVRRAIPPAAFPKFIKDVGQLQTPTTLGKIDKGSDWPVNVSLIGSTEISTIWVLEGGKKRGIPSGEVMDYYHFDRTKVILKSPNELAAIPDGPLIEPPAKPTLDDPCIKIKRFPIVRTAGGAKGSAKVTVNADGVVTLYMKVNIDAFEPNAVKYTATVLISGWHDSDPFSVLSPSLPAHTLTIAAGPVDDEKDKTWVLYSVKPEDLHRIREVYVFLDRDKSKPDAIATVVESLKRVGEVWDAADVLYKKVKNSDLGQDLIHLVATS